MVEALIAHFTDGNKAQFAKVLGVSPQTISAWIARSTFDSELIYTKCRDISPAWLLTGEGSMLKSSTPSIDGATTSPSEAPPISEKSEKISSAEDTTAFLAYMDKKDQVIKEKDAIIEQKNQEITSLKCHITRLEGENRHLIDELDRLKMEHPQQPATATASSSSSTTSTDSTISTSSPEDTSLSTGTPRSHTA